MPCCNITNVDWLQPGGLIRCESCCLVFNWPCCPAAIQSTSWHETKKEGKTLIIYPLNEAMAMFLIAMPLTGCMLFCIDPGALALIVTYDNDSLDVVAEMRRKTTCGEHIEAKRTKVTKAYVEDKPGGFLSSRTARISIHSDDGMAPVMTEFVTISNDGEFQSLKSLVEKINTFVAEAASSKTLRAAGAVPTNAASIMRAAGVISSQPMTPAITSPVQVMPIHPGGYPQQQHGYVMGAPPAVLHHSPVAVAPAPGVYGVPPQHQHAPVVQMQMIPGPSAVYGSPPPMQQQPAAAVYGAPVAQAYPAGGGGGAAPPTYVQSQMTAMLTH